MSAAMPMARMHARVPSRLRPPAAISVICLLLIVGAVLFVPGFASAGNLLNVSLQVAVLLMLAMPQTLVILSEGLDLASGALLSLCAVLLAQTLAGGQGLLPALAVAMAVGLVFGLVTGLLIAYLDLPPFVVTLGGFGIAQGIALVLTEGNAVTGIGPSAAAFYAQTLLGLPLVIWLALAVCLITYVLLYRTRFGNHIFAIGGNRDALVLAGVNARASHVMIYVYSGLVVGLAALLLTGRMNSGHPTGAIGMEFDAIAAVVLGGTSFEKGKGGLTGTVVGVITIGVLRNMLNILGIESSMQVVSIGVLVIFVVLCDGIAQARHARA
jgi:ribose transport system permease protein